MAAVVAIPTALLAAQDAPPAIDREAFAVAADLRSPTLTDVMLEVTELGSLPATVPALAVAALLLAGSGRPRAAAALVVGMALTVATVHLLKEVVVERPRPEDPLGTFGGLAYPSGHAAQAMAWVWIAAATHGAIPRRLWWAAAVVAVVLAVAVGLTRVYLRVHFLTDVIGGWAVGLAGFALAFAVLSRTR